jgi:cation diffusion facilitator family transporter
MTSLSSTRLTVYAALLGNLLVAATKTVAALWTGSSAMLSEAVHSFVDTGNELLLLYGMRSSMQRPDPEHPLGYGRELYFWSFIVALMVFALGAGVSIYQGIAHVRQPQPISRPLVSYVVFGLCFLFEGSTWLISLRQFKAAKGPLGYYQAFRRSKNPPSFMVLFEDSAALVGIAIGVAGTFAATTLNVPVADGMASILIGLVLAVVAALLARESKSLLIGERGDRRLDTEILRIAQEQGPIARVNGLLTVQLAPKQIVAALSVQFADDIRASEIEALVQDLEQRIRQQHPGVVGLFVKPQTDENYCESMRRRFGEAWPAGAGPTSCMRRPVHRRVDACRAAAIPDEPQQAAGDRQVLHEIDHLGLISSEHAISSGIGESHVPIGFELRNIFSGWPAAPASFRGDHHRDDY